MGLGFGEKIGENYFEFMCKLETNNITDNIRFYILGFLENQDVIQLKSFLKVLHSMFLLLAKYHKFTYYDNVVCNNDDI